MNKEINDYSFIEMTESTYRAVLVLECSPNPKKRQLLWRT